MLGIVFYPLTANPYFSMRIDIFSARASGLVVAVVLWLYILPRDLAYSLAAFELAPRFAVPLTAYLCGLGVVAVLTKWAFETRKP